MVKRSPYPDAVIPNVPIQEYILEQIKEYGDDIAMVDNTRGNSVTFRQLHENVIKCAGALHKRGFGNGDVLALCATNRVEYPIVILAVASCGGIVTTCNPLSTAGEILRQFKLSKPKMVFCEPELLPQIQSISSEFRFRFRFLPVPSLKETITFGKTTSDCLSYEDLLLDDDGKGCPPVSIDPKEQLVMLPYSSGTTGLPKGVMLTHQNLVAQVIPTSVTFFEVRSSCLYLILPMFHTAGYSTMLVNLAKGAKTVIDARFNPEKMFQAFETYKVTHFFAVPPLLLFLLQTNLMEKYDVSSLQQILYGAAPTAPSVITALTAKYKIAATPVYGLTEMVPLTMGNPIFGKLDSVGFIVPNTIVKVVDTKTGEEMAPDEDGEILAKGPQMMKGYLGNPEATAQTIDKDGWFHTGDIGHFDKDGMLYLVDRLKEMIKYKGFQIAPAELESVLLSHPEISDAAVIGVPEKDAGEVPKAFVVKKSSSLTEETVKNFVAKELSHYKHLKGGVEFINAIPKSASGKILRRELRK